MPLGGRSPPQSGWLVNRASDAASGRKRKSRGSAVGFRFRPEAADECLLAARLNYRWEPKPLMQFDCGVCSVRPWQLGDEAALVRHANSREIWLNLRDQFPHPYTVQDATSWVESASAGDPPTHFAIVLQDAVGGVGFSVQGDIGRVSAEIGYWLSASHWNKGIMTAAVRAVTDYAFARFSLTRVFAVPFAGNVASHRVLEKLGYVREGVLRRSAIKDGTVLDQVIYALTDRDRSEHPQTASGH